MSSLSFIMECDSFQHGTNDFSLKCLAAASGWTRTTYYRLFNTSQLLTRGPDTLRTYQHQTMHHGWTLMAAGLPQGMARSVVMHAVLEAFLDLSERGDVAPAQVIIWVKGGKKTAFVKRVIDIPNLPCLFLVRNLEDVVCLTAPQLEPADPGLLLTQEKARLFSTWLLSEGLDSDPVGRRSL